MDVNTQYDTFEASSPDDAPENTNSGGEKQDSWGGFAWFLLKLILAVLIFRSFIFSPFSIPSESMLPRFWTGDYLLASKWSYGYSKYSLPYNAPLIPGRIFASTPERGDLVIFKHPVDEKDYIKRVIGLPGDTIALVDGQVILNGKPLPREAVGDFEIPVSPNTPCPFGIEEARGTDGKAVCRYTRFRETLPGGRSYDTLDFGMMFEDNFEQVTVPEGRMFVMGDNRDNSQDSRFPATAGGGVGLVPLDNLVGEATIIMWSTDGSAEWYKPWTWFTAARGDRIGEVM